MDSEVAVRCTERMRLSMCNCVGVAVGCCSVSSHAPRDLWRVVRARVEHAVFSE